MSAPKNVRLQIVYPITAITVNYLARKRTARRPQCVLVKIESPEGREVVELHQMLACLEQAWVDIARTIEDCERQIEQSEIRRIAEEADLPHAPDHLPLPSEIEDLLKSRACRPARSSGRRRDAYHHSRD